MTIKVKICGVKDLAVLEAAVDCGADFIGFVFFDRSSRYVSPKAAAGLCKAFNRSVGEWEKVALFVNPTDEYIKEVVADFLPDIFQLHGTENKERILQIRSLFTADIKIMKSFPISSKTDIEAVISSDCLDVVDYLLFDAKPPVGSVSPGGNALSFDWQLLNEINCFKDSTCREIPWMLAGGLSADNVEDAVGQSRAQIVDVSSGVEKSAGIKDPVKIRKFIKVVKELE
ncbi:MAG: phosphoribosylanthranilate isomerase [Alphaproteobacteria bacterium]|nr:phosphoribosylanthranilate isomerase [Alphaproteobacteria bacterium]